MSATAPTSRVLLVYGGLTLLITSAVGAAFLLVRQPPPAPVQLAPVQAASVQAAAPAPVPAAPTLAARSPAVPAPAAPLPAAPLPPAPDIPAPAVPVAPTFDIVRVGPNGRAVIAGRAEPGAQVVVRDGAREVGQARADGRGEWVLLPDAPLAPGGRELTLASRTPGKAEAQGDSVLLSVPAPASSAAPAPPPVALLVPGAGAPRLLGAPAAPAALGLSRVDYDERGEMRFAGTAPPGAPVRVYVDNAPAGEATADAQGRWGLVPGASVAAGQHRLRVDQLGPAGRVQARVELPFQRSSLSVAELASGRSIVQPGENLWRIARHVYGTGVRYTVIYLANRDQIRDPKRIFPGQALAVPVSR